MPHAAKSRSCACTTALSAGMDIGSAFRQDERKRKRWSGHVGHCWFLWFDDNKTRGAADGVTGRVKKD
jgi:hypothetical protein